jgi:GNAT superfamily N-acetyltransferase
MVDIVAFDPDEHRTAWSAFVTDAYKNPNYVLLSPAFLRWQFLDNPANATGSYTLWLVLHQGKVVAQLGFVPFVGRAPGGETFSGAHPINLIVRPDYRAAGLGVIILKQLLKQTQCVLNPGANDAGAALGMGLGMRDLGMLRRYIAVLDEARARPLAAENRLPRGVAVAPASETGGSGILRATRLPDDAPDVFEFPVPLYGVERSRPFLKWRYERHPGFAYEFLLSDDRASLLVFHEEREPGTGTLVLRIVDFLARGHAQALLLRELLRIGRERGAALADFFCSADCYDAALQTTGFCNEANYEDGRIAALFQPLDFRKVGIRVLVSGPSGGSESPGQWYVAKGDSDQDRPNDQRVIRSADSA